MRRLIRSAFVIARRDYVATVFSRTFLLFLIGPLLPALFTAGFTTLALKDDRPSHAPVVIAIAKPHDGTALLAARERLAAQIGRDRLPSLKIASPPANPERLLDSDDEPVAVLSGSFDHPVLTGPEAKAFAGRIAAIIDQARQMAMLGDRLPPSVWVTVHQSAVAPAPKSDDLRDLARGAQLGLFFLIVILAGVLLSNLVEEKSNKVIEVLAAAAPIDAIFAGKLAGMLAVSLTGIAAWAGMGAAFGLIALHPGAIPTPAVGWPAFVVLAGLYFAMLYLLVGALFLGIGAQANSVREVQTLSMPLTMAQLLIYGLASVGLPHPDGALGIIAAVVPWSSPYAMLARAAQQPALWPHLIALLWQIVCIAVVIRIGAQLFRLTVLKSGGLRRKRG
ncbi:ABC transporter permease [Sphingomonas sp. MMS24-J13]|uniref:ABC transporter permease n=1 Tax=Sphingomonas sp. MMS24-J13 TaxID=3238686 RepID=UPI0038509421